MVSPLVVILGAGRPHVGTSPSALVRTSGDKRVLDWLLEAFNQSCVDATFHFVGGYRLTEIVDEYPHIHFTPNEKWEETGPVASLLTAPLPENRPVYVCYADTIFEASAVEALDGTTAIAVDGGWKTRYEDRTADSLDRAETVTTADGALVDASAELDPAEADAEFTGLLRLSPEAVERVQALWNARTIAEDADMLDLLRALRATGIDVETVDIGDDWAELETAADLSRFVLDTKANTLRRLRSMVDRSTILAQVSFTVAEWETDRESICARIRTTFEDASVIVRSSALAEDGFEESNAGRFESVLDVPTDDAQSIATAIDRVIGSYHEVDPDDQVLVQPMIDDVDQSGVVMTRSLETSSPYYVVNYDATTSSTETVTDGTGEHLRTAVVRKDLVTEAGLAREPGASHDGVDRDGLVAPARPQRPSELRLEPLVSAVREIEALVGHDSLDVEFAVDTRGDVYVFQVRPMPLDPAENAIDDEAVFDSIRTAQAEFRDSQTPSPHVLGDRTIYGVMPDWNPAEIIGRRPRRLATSLYRYLITDETWARQRAEYGYRDVRPQPLMTRFAGQPYVDVRADVNSFIPRSVPDELAERLVTYYLDRLEANPELHDKIEFDVVLTCLTFDFDRQIEPLLEAGFTTAELEPLREGLREITREAFDRIDRDTATIADLEARYERVTNADLPPLREASHLLNDCKRLGTLPFAHLARTAFVATSLLRSLERIGVLTPEQRRAFQNSLNTVARQFERDAYRVAQGETAWDAFVEKYGHLRPGTYELTSPTYAQNPDDYLRPVVDRATEPDATPEPTDVWDEETKREIEAELDRIGLPADADGFVTFLVSAIEGREHSKFVFSRNVSRALELIAAFGERHGLSREALSHVTIDDLFELVVEQPPTDVASWLDRRVTDGQTLYDLTRSVELPPLLFDEADFCVFERPAREPNVVTDEVVTADVVHLDDATVDAAALDGKLIMIEQADPGYDWLFGHDIAGLITKYGGANSHMAVRAAEFSLPAAIGVGENRYEQLARGAVVELDCAARTIAVIR